VEAILEVGGGGEEYVPGARSIVGSGPGDQGSKPSP